MNNQQKETGATEATNLDKLNLEKFDFEEAFSKLKQDAKAKFDESIDVAINLGSGVKKSVQSLRGSVVLPNGVGKKEVILAIVPSDKEEEAKKAGADLILNDDIISKIKQGKISFTKCVATPKGMPLASKVAKQLGPKGLMPNPKTGTVGDDIAKVIDAVRKGMVEFRADKTWIIHSSIGKMSFGAKKLKENFDSFFKAVKSQEPQEVKGSYIESVFISSTMSLGSVKLNA